MPVALGADVEVLLQVLFQDALPASVTLHPQPLGAHLALARGVQLTGLSLEPGHSSRASSAVGHWRGVESGSKLRVGGNGQRRTTNDDSVLDYPLRHHALFIGMLYLAHFGDGV